MARRCLITPTLVLASLALLLLLGSGKNHWFVNVVSAQVFPPPPQQCGNEPKFISMKEAAGYALVAGFRPDQGNKGSDAATIVAIAWEESGGETFACNYNPPLEISLGILQINILEHKSTFIDENDPTVAINLHIVFTPAKALEWSFPNLLRSPRGFNHWSVFSNGKYTDSLPDACKAVAHHVGDINGDGIVNSIDWSIMNAVWFTNDSTADINGDGIVNSIDFGFMNAHWFIELACGA